MKSIDDDKLIAKTDKMLDYISQNALKTHIGKLTLEWPKGFFYQMMAGHKYWEADDISDVINNYSLVDKVSKDFMKQPENMSLLKKALMDSIDKSNLSIDDFEEIKTILADMTKASDEICKELGWRTGHSNPNQVSLDNVYLGDYDEFKNNIYTRCNLTVKDRRYKTIPGMVLFSEKMLKGSDTDSIKKSLEMARSYKDYTMAFDIEFQALPKYRMNIEPHVPGAVLETVYKGPKLYITNITKTGGDKKIFRPADIGMFVPTYP
ncbi:MAG: hypothetical protein ACP5OA_07045 [Candidatus Woesearchaeota archaeon]